MKLLFEIEVNVRKPTLREHPDPEAAILSIGQSIERAITYVRVLYRHPITLREWNSEDYSPYMPRPIDVELQGRFIGVGVE